MSNELKAKVREKYGEAATRAAAGQRSSCCGASSAKASCCDPITTDLYDRLESGQVPTEALQASLGCGNPTALADLRPGETVLDLGSGGGIDVLLSARRVGPEGMAYGLDMTDEMLSLAEDNRRRSGLTNVRFLKGDIEHIPLPSNSVDVVISNCVINLAADKDLVLKEAFRVLKPGGRFAVSDVIVHGEVPALLRENADLWMGCVAGALSDREYVDKLANAGFGDVGIEETRRYSADDARVFLAVDGLDADTLAEGMDGAFASAFVRAKKPAACCQPGCCEPRA